MTQYRPRSSIPPVVKNLILINILMLVAIWALNSTGANIEKKLALFYPGSDDFRPYQFITHMFVHAGIFHLFFNMFALYMFGRILESVWGPKRFLSYYLITGLGAAALHMFVRYLEISSIQQAVTAFSNTPTPELFRGLVSKHFTGMFNRSEVYEFINKWEEVPSSSIYIENAKELANYALASKINIPSVGASGAVYGILLAFGVLFPNTQLMLIFPPIPIKAKYAVFIYGAIELFLGVTKTGSNIAHFAHLGGMVFGYILIMYWRKNSNSFY